VNGFGTSNQADGTELRGLIPTPDYVQLSEWDYSPILELPAGSDQPPAKYVKFSRQFGGFLNESLDLGSDFQPLLISDQQAKDAPSPCPRKFDQDVDIRKQVLM
jgi:hypothetical protein